jgi:hypothetical protein
VTSAVRCLSSASSRAPQPPYSRATASTTVEIARPPDEVFAFVTDPTKLSAGQDAEEVLQLTEGPVRAGTRFREIHKAMGPRRVELTKVIECDPGRLFQIRVVEGPPVDGRPLVGVTDDAEALQIARPGRRQRQIRLLRALPRSHTREDPDVIKQPELPPFSPQAGTGRDRDGRQYDCSPRRGATRGRHRPGGGSSPIRSSALRASDEHSGRPTGARRASAVVRYGQRAHVAAAAA